MLTPEKRTQGIGKRYVASGNPVVTDGYLKSQKVRLHVNGHVTQE